MLEELLKRLIPNESSELRARRVQGARGIIALTAAVGSVSYYRHYMRSHPVRLSASGWNWFCLVGGVVWAYSVASDIRSGSTNPSSYVLGDKYAYKRSADPVGYWIVIALQVAAVAGLVVASLGDLVGLWKWNWQ